MIKPTIGRVVWFYSTKDSEPMAAIITKVWNDECVNLAVFDPCGILFGKTSVTLIQEYMMTFKPEYDYAEWMPYQKGQAAKTEELEKKIQEGESK